MICDNCGHINPNINKRCDKCGKELEPAPRYPTERNKSTNRTYDKNEGLFDDIKNLSTEKKIIGVCCLILLAIFAVSSVLPYNNDSTIIPYDNNTTDHITDVNNTPEVVQTPSKVNTNINVTAKSPVISGESTIIKGYLLDESKNPLYNCEVIVKIANNEFNIKTKHDGSYTLEYNDTENGSQNVSVVFEENANYHGCYNNTFFEVVNNTTDDNNDTNNTTSNHTISENNTYNDTKNKSDDDHDNHDTHNSILSWIFGNRDKQNNNLTNDGNDSTNNTTNHGNSRSNHTINNSVDNNNTTDSNKSTNNTTTENNTTNSLHPDDNKNNTADDNNNTTDNLDKNNTTTNNTHNNTTDDMNKDNHHHAENNTTQLHNDTDTSNDTKTSDDKSDTKLDVKIENNITENEPTKINGTLVDENNTPIANAVIKIKIDDKEAIVHTDSHGEYSIEYTPTSDDTKHVEVIYEGDDKYSSTHKSGILSIK